MTDTGYDILIIIILTVIASILLLRTIQLHRKTNVLASKLLEAHTLLTEAETELEVARKQFKESLNSKESLDEAELTTRLQQLRLAAQHCTGQAELPKRYQYIRSLLRSGMNPAEIATVMSISKQEAEQLVNLSNLVEKSEKNVTT